MKKTVVFALFVCTLANVFSQGQFVKFGQRLSNVYYWNWYDYLAYNNPDSTFECYPYERYPFFNQPIPSFISRYIETENPMNIIGVAAPIELFQNGNNISVHYPDSLFAETFRLYQATDSGLVIKAEAEWIPQNPRFQMELQSKTVFDTFYVREAYFHEPVTVFDSFYVAGSGYSNIPRFPDSLGNWNYEFNPFKYLFYAPYPMSADVATAIPGYYLGKTISVWPYWNTPEWFKEGGTPMDTNHWEYVHINFFLGIFPIFDTNYVYVPPVDTCPRATGLHILNQDSAGVTLAWNDNGTSGWELSYGIDGTVADSGTVVPCTVNFTTLSGLDTAQWYVAYVRSVCGDTLPSLWSQGVRFYVAGDTASGGGDEPTGIYSPSMVDLYTFLMPNPASGKVTVTSSFKIVEVEIFSADGRLVECRKGDGIGLTMDVSEYANGTYIARIRTVAGVATKRLVVY